MEITKPIVHSIIDTTTTPGYIYVGEAPIASDETSDVWTIARISTSSPYEINYGRSGISWNLEKKLKNKWTDRAVLTY